MTARERERIRGRKKEREGGWREKRGMKRENQGEGETEK